MKTYKVFNYIETLDCFVVNKDFKEIIDYLGLTEWNEVVWIGRYFMLDNDYGEHWLEREAIEESALKLGYEHECLMIIEPSRMANGNDGPCHTNAERKRFWTDVFKSLTLSIETIIAEAKINNERHKQFNLYFIPDLKIRIENILNNKILI